MNAVLLSLFNLYISIGGVSRASPVPMLGTCTPEQLYDQEIHTVSIPDSTRLSGIATPEIIAEAVAFLHKDGIVILDNAIEKANIETLNNKLSVEALEIAQSPDHHFNFGMETRNMDQAPPAHSRAYVQGHMVQSIRCCRAGSCARS